MSAQIDGVNNPVQFNQPSQTVERPAENTAPPPAATTVERPQPPVDTAEISPEAQNANQPQRQAARALAEQTRLATVANEVNTVQENVSAATQSAVSPAQVTAAQEEIDQAVANVTEQQQAALEQPSRQPNAPRLGETSAIDTVYSNLGEIQNSTGETFAFTDLQSGGAADLSNPENATAVANQAGRDVNAALSEVENLRSATATEITAEQLNAVEAQLLSAQSVQETLDQTRNAIEQDPTAIFAASQGVSSSTVANLL